ncbi:MAG: hypothetical protein WB421_19520 [Terriglobales bacterium]
MEFTPDSAKQFLLSKLAEQASHDGVALDEIERKMFLFSESSGSPDLDANEKFERGYDSRKYESKVSKLLRRSYAGDKKTEDGKASWKAALKALSREDFYGLVMVDQAGIPRTDAGVWTAFLEVVPLLLAEIAVLGVGAVLVFRPSGFGLHLPDWFRLLLMPLFLWLFWYVGKVFGRNEMEKAAKRIESQRR